MSYRYGDKITAASQPYTMQTADSKAVGVRVYGPAGEQRETDPTGHYWVLTGDTNTQENFGFADVGEEAIPEGGYTDVFAVKINRFTADDTDIADLTKDAGTWETRNLMDTATPEDHDFAFIYVMDEKLITDRIATITIEGEAIVRFDVPHDVYGIYGENIKASLNEDFEDTDQGVYDTADTGKATIAHYTRADRLYLKGTGTVKIWAGQSPLDDPFAV